MSTKKVSKRKRQSSRTPERADDNRRDVISSVIQELAPLFARLEDSLRTIGEKLFEHRAVLGQGGVAATIQVCHARWGVSHALLRTWYRVATGELPEHLVTQTKIQKTTLQHMPAEVATELAENQEYLVVSSALGRAVKKRISVMTADECARHIAPQGFIPLENANDGSTTYRHFQASGISVDSDKKRIVLTVERARITVSAGAKSLQSALKQLLTSGQV